MMNCCLLQTDLLFFSANPFLFHHLVPNYIHLFRRPLWKWLRNLRPRCKKINQGLPCGLSSWHLHFWGVCHNVRIAQRIWLRQTRSSVTFPLGSVLVSIRMHDEIKINFNKRYCTWRLHITHCRRRRQAACPLPATRRSSHNAAGYLLQRGCSHCGNASTRVNKKAKSVSSHEEHNILYDLTWNSIPVVLMGQRWLFFVSPSGRWKTVNGCSSKKQKGKKKSSHIWFEKYFLLRSEKTSFEIQFSDVRNRWHHDLDHTIFYLLLRCLCFIFW